MITKMKKILEEFVCVSLGLLVMRQDNGLEDFASSK